MISKFVISYLLISTDFIDLCKRRLTALTQSIKYRGPIQIMLPTESVQATGIVIMHHHQEVLRSVVFVCLLVGSLVCSLMCSFLNSHPATGCSGR